MPTYTAEPTLYAAEDVRVLTRGTRFTFFFTRTLSRQDRHSVWYYTANRAVTLTLRDGSTLEGTLNETPSYFAQNQRLWLRIPGRKTRKGVNLDDIAQVIGLRAPTLEEAFTALIGVTAGNPSPELAAEARSIIADM